MYVGWTAASSGKEYRISADINNLTLSSLFSASEWGSGGTKTVIIDPGVTIGSTNPANPSLATGTLSGGQSLGGTIKLINNGNIYGAGGNGGSSSAGGVGGTALQATVPINLTNNGNMWAGGGGGGAGGQGVNAYWWPETYTWHYSIDNIYFPTGSENKHWVTWPGGTVAYYEHAAATPPAPTSAAPSSTSHTVTSLTEGGYTYYRGDLVGVLITNTYYKIRRRTTNRQGGGTGGNGGKGAGSDNLVQDGGLSGNVANVSTGGAGGAGGGFGSNGNTGITGGTINWPYADGPVGPWPGDSGGLGGYYVDGDSNVTWIVPGNRLGRVTG